MCLPRSGKAFSLIELLLVIAIMGFLSAVIVPAFTNSIKGSKLRSAVRSVVVMGRYARTMSLLKQQELAVTFDFSSSTISISPMAVAAAPQNSTNFPGRVVPSMPAAGMDGLTNPDESNQFTVASIRAETTEMKRKLEGVNFAYVELSKGTRQNEGTCVVYYRSNGTCTPYDVKVIDERGTAVLIRIDALSSATTEEVR